MSAITTHVLDMLSGRPGAGISVVLERKTHTVGWQAIATGITNMDGRINDLIHPSEAFLPGHYRLIFETSPYFLVNNVEGFFPQITVSFTVKDPAQHYHVPLLLSPNGYTAYRGS